MIFDANRACGRLAHSAAEHSDACRWPSAGHAVSFFALAALVLAGCSERAADAPVAAQTASVKPQPLATPTLPELREQLDHVLDFTEHGRIMSLEKHAAWQLLHGVLAFGPKFEILAGKDKVVALDWVFSGKPMRGWTLEAEPPYGVEATIEPGKLGQGHDDQWLAIISQWPVPRSTPVTVDGQPFRLADLVNYSMYKCYQGKEASWSIIALSTHLDSIDMTWTAMDGHQWSVEKLVSMEAGPVYDEAEGQMKINLGACGGTHRLIGLAIALNNYRHQHPEIADDQLVGGWAAANRRVTWAVEQAKNNQLPSGAFSIQFFQRPANSASIDEHLAATGHTLEFLSFALPKEELEKPWVRRAVGYLCRLLERTKHIDLECGSLYHAAHGLVLYRMKVFGDEASTVAAGRTSAAN